MPNVGSNVHPCCSSNSKWALGEELRLYPYPLDGWSSVSWIPPAHSLCLRPPRTMRTISSLTGRVQRSACQHLPRAQHKHTLGRGAMKASHANRKRGCVGNLAPDTKATLSAYSSCPHWHQCQPCQDNRMAAPGLWTSCPHHSADATLLDFRSLSCASRPGSPSWAFVHLRLGY